MLRGAFGYIAEKKKTYLRKTVIYTLIGLAIFVVGYFINNCSASNVFTIVAILMVLPGAKAVVGYVIFHPFQTVTRNRYEKVYEVASRIVNQPRSMEEVMKDTIVKEDILNLYTDVVFTSPEKVMNFDFLLLAQTRGIALLGKEKQDLAYIETYLKEGLAARNYTYGVKVYHSMDPFVKAIDKMDGKEEPKDSSKETRAEVVEYIESLIVV